MPVLAFLSVSLDSLKRMLFHSQCNMCESPSAFQWNFLLAFSNRELHFLFPFQAYIQTVHSVPFPLWYSYPVLILLSKLYYVTLCFHGFFGGELKIDSSISIFSCYPLPSHLLPNCHLHLLYPQIRSVSCVLQLLHFHAPFGCPSFPGLLSFHTTFPLLFYAVSESLYPDFCTNLHLPSLCVSIPSTIETLMPLMNSTYASSFSTFNCSLGSAFPHFNFFRSIRKYPTNRM